MEQNKQCCNCKHFLEYYVKYNCKFKSVERGTCLMKRRGSKPVQASSAGCEKWEDNEELKEAEKITIEKAFINASNSLKRIAEVLTHEEI